MRNVSFKQVKAWGWLHKKAILLYAKNGKFAYCTYLSVIIEYLRDGIMLNPNNYDGYIYIDSKYKLPISGCLKGKKKGGE